MDKLYANWDELVFEYRRKDYGAYLMRYNYPSYVTIATLIVLFIFICSTVGPKLFSEEAVQQEVQVTKIQYVDLKEAPPIERIETPKPAVAKYVAPKVVEEEVKPEEELPTIDQAIAEADTSIVTEAAPAPVAEVIEVVEPPPVVEEVKAPEPVREPVVIKPSFSGGTDALKDWLSKHINYPAMAVRMGIQGRVLVEFTVDEKGKISNVTVKESLHKLCDNEAVRLVKAMPDWNPGSIDGVATTQTYQQPISFVLK